MKNIDSNVYCEIWSGEDTVSGNHQIWREGDATLQSVDAFIDYRSPIDGKYYGNLWKDGHPVGDFYSADLDALDGVFPGIVADYRGEKEPVSTALQEKLDRVKKNSFFYRRKNRSKK